LAGVFFFFGVLFIFGDFFFLGGCCDGPAVSSVGCLFLHSKELQRE